MPSNNFDSLVNNFGDILSRFNNNLLSAEQAQKEVINLLKNSSVDAIQSFKNALLDSEKQWKQAADNELRSRADYEKQLNDLLQQYNKKQEDILIAQERLNLTSDDAKRKQLEKEIELAEKEADVLSRRIDINQAVLNGEADLARKKTAQLETDLENEKAYQERKKQIQAEEEKARREHLEKTKNFINSAFSKLGDLLKTITETYTTATNNVTNTYNQHAGNLSALLDSTVSDISQMQQNIASSLRNTNLNGAISNVAVLNEASSLASAGYTDAATLQQNATDIAIGREIAPTADFGNATVRNLINIFGSDFTTRFAAIQQAVQDTAGSAVGVQQTMSTLMTNLEPVFMNAQYQLDAIQGTADVAATLANAREQGIIDQSQEAEYRSMIMELMDPSRALKSSNIAVRTAATTYDWSSNSPADALNAILQATQNIYSNVGQSDSGTDRLSRSLYASVMGQNTMSATYNQQGYTDVTMIGAADLDETYADQLNKLQSGDYTTRSEEIANRAENSQLTQSIASFAKDYPRLYRTMSTAILGAINGLPAKIGRAISGSLSYGGSGSVGDIDIGSSGGTGDSGGLATSIGDMYSMSKAGGGAGLKATTGAGFVKNLSSAVGGRTGSLAMLSYGAGIAGAVNVGSSIAENGWGWQGWGMQGDTASAMTNYAGIGGAIGSLIAPGLGTAIGTLAGAIGGLLLATKAQNELEEENNRLIEEQNALTSSVLGPGIEKLSTLEQKAEIARGGGLVTLNSGVVAMDMDVPRAASGIDYVPYDDYLVKLHKGESVVTAKAAASLRKEDPNFWFTPRSNNDDVIHALERQTKSIVGAVKGDTELLPMQQQGPKTYNIRNVSLA